MDDQTNEFHREKHRNGTSTTSLVWNRLSIRRLVLEVIDPLANCIRFNEIKQGNQMNDQTNEVFPYIRVVRNANAALEFASIWCD
jgi:hypothetical protein